MQYTGASPLPLRRYPLRNASPAVKPIAKAIVPRSRAEETAAAWKAANAASKKRDRDVKNLKAALKRTKRVGEGTVVGLTSYKFGEDGQELGRVLQIHPYPTYFEVRWAGSSKKDEAKWVHVHALGGYQDRMVSEFMLLHAKAIREKAQELYAKEQSLQTQQQQQLLAPGAQADGKAPAKDGDAVAAVDDIHLKEQEAMEHNVGVSRSLLLFHPANAERAAASVESGDERPSKKARTTRSSASVQRAASEHSAVSRSAEVVRTLSRQDTVVQRPTYTQSLT